MRKRKRVLYRVVAAVICIIFLMILLFMHRSANQILISVSEATMRTYATTAVNEAVCTTLTEDARYDKLVTIERDAQGNVTSVTTNSFYINRIARDTAVVAQNKLIKLSEQGVPVPLGAFSGIKFLAGFGNEIYVKIISVNSVTCRFASTFEEAGINQTKHAIMLVVCSEVNVIMPTNRQTFLLDNEVLLCESIIAGKVPDFYMQNGQKP